VPTRARSTAHWIVLAGAALCPLALLALATLLSPAPEGHGTHTQLGLPACSFHAWTGLPCPGCGVTTAACLVAHGELERAFLTQPFGAALALGLVLFPAWAALQVLRGRDLGRRWPTWVSRTLLAGGALLALGAWIRGLIAATG
jgi:hypothetical protein